MAAASPVAAVAMGPKSGILHLLDWFVPAAWLGTATMRQRCHVFVIAHLAGVVLGILTLLGFYETVPGSWAVLRWITPLLLGFLILPFGLRQTGRLDAMGAASAQLFTLAILIPAGQFGGMVSPLLPWLVLAFSTNFYYLAPWPRWRNANLALQLVQVAAFVAIVLRAAPAADPVPAQTLLVVGLISAGGVVTLMAVIAFHIWSMHVDQRRLLEQEIAERRAIEAEGVRTERELRKSRDHLAHSQRVGKIGSAEIDYSQSIATWSEALFALLGRDPAAGALEADEFDAIVHADDRAFVRMRREREGRGDYPRASEFRVLLPNGEIRWIRRQAEPLEWRNGRPLRAIATYLDVTEQKDAQQAVVELEEQLSQAHKMEAVGQLTGGVAHDFNNLLAVLLGRLQMIDDALVNPRPDEAAELQEWVRSCIRAVNRGATLTKSMMAFSRQQALAPVVLNANEVVADMEEMLRRALGETYQLRAVQAPDLWNTEADAGQLQNALLNLVLNARDATPGGGELVIETRNARLGPEYVAHNLDVAIGDYVELSVADKGSGMPPDVAKRAFEPFFTTKDVGKGSGLGLSMVYGFVKQSGGHVAIESRVGQGTTVRIFLPRREETAAGKPAATSGPVAAAGGRETILLVEDNDDLRDVTRRRIERIGYTVMDTAQAADALELLNQHAEVRLLISDVVLPQGMNGVELAEIAISRDPALKVILISGYNDAHDAFKRAQGRFPLRFLQKPFQANELAEEIRAALAS
jgi:PAS domain S-box-containing protein